MNLICFLCRKEIENCKSPLWAKPLCDDCLVDVLRQYFDSDNYKSPLIIEFTEKEMKFNSKRPIDYSALRKALKEALIRLAILDYEN